MCLAHTGAAEGLAPAVWVCKPQASPVPNGRTAATLKATYIVCTTKRRLWAYTKGHWGLFPGPNLHTDRLGRAAAALALGYR